MFLSNIYWNFDITRKCLHNFRLALISTNSVRHCFSKRRYLVYALKYASVNHSKETTLVEYSRCERLALFFWKIHPKARTMKICFVSFKKNFNRLSTSFYLFVGMVLYVSIFYCWRFSLGVFQHVNEPPFKHYSNSERKYSSTNGCIPIDGN